MGKLTIEQIETMIEGLNTIEKLLKAEGKAVLDFDRYSTDSTDAIGVAFSLETSTDIASHYEAKFAKVFGFAPQSFDSTEFTKGLTNLQVKVAALFVSSVAENDSRLIARIETSRWLEKLAMVRGDLVGAVEKRKRKASAGSLQETQAFCSFAL